MTAPEREQTVSRTELVHAAMQEIRKNYREACLTTVADAYGVSLAYVSECVREQTGKTYKALLQKRRLEAAARLLRSSSLRVDQVIERVGYKNTSYFFHLFYARYGQTPREYRDSRTRA